MRLKAWNLIHGSSVETLKFELEFLSLLFQWKAHLSDSSYQKRRSVGESHELTGQKPRFKAESDDRENCVTRVAIGKSVWN